ncbi:unnamed protein product [Sphenostylis stenocarpa]|uniref:Uncharacterized protein n=1 Tax=Sphenostylis stenocarpa TaxID=92480 RepID=A0AA86W203_9FABA|nr:unnamed protein product [Sphenostylis stenocarpa]
MNEVRGTRHRITRGIYGGITTHGTATLKWSYQFRIATWRSYTCSWQGAMVRGMSYEARNIQRPQKHNALYPFDYAE